MVEFKNLLKKYNKDTKNLKLVKDHILDNLSSSSITLTNVKILMSMAEMKNHPEGIAISYYLLACIYLENDQIERAEKHIYKAEAIFNTINEKERLDNYLSIYLFYNDYYLKKNNLAKIYRTNKNALKLLDNLDQRVQNDYRVRFITNYLGILVQLGLDEEVLDLAEELVSLEKFLNPNIKIKCTLYEAIATYNLGEIDLGLKILTDSYNLNNKYHILSTINYFTSFVRMFVEINDFVGAKLYVKYLEDSINKVSGSVYLFSISTLMRYYYEVNDDRFLKYEKIILAKKLQSIYNSYIYRDLAIVTENRDLEKHLKALEYIYKDDDLKFSILKDIHLQDKRMNEMDNQFYKHKYNNFYQQIFNINNFHLELAKLRDPIKISEIVANTGKEVFKDEIKLEYLDLIELDINLLLEFNDNNELIIDYVNYPGYFKDNDFKSIYFKLIRNQENAIIACLIIKSKKITNFKIGKYQLLPLFVDYLHSYIKNIIKYSCPGDNCNNDYLTRAVSKNAFKDLVNKIKPKNACLAIVNIDFLEEINQKYSYFAGDIVIFDLIESLKNQFGKNHIAKLNGQEFIILSHKRIDEFEKDINQCLFRISNHILNFRDYDLTYSFSCGITLLADYKDFDLALIKAEKNSEIAKNNGGNQIVIGN